MPQRSQHANAPWITRKRVILVLVTMLAAATLRTLRDMSRTPTSFEGIERAAREHPSDLEAQLSLGAALQQRGRLQDAEAIFIGADKLDSKDERAPVWLGMIAVQQHRTTAAIAEFRRALERNPQDSDVWLSLAQLQQSIGALTSAATAFEQVVRIQPANETAWRSLGAVDIRLKLLARGEVALRQAIRLVPKDPQAKGMLGALELRLGKLEEARSDLQFAQELDPNNAATMAQPGLVTIRLDASPSSLRAAMGIVSRSIALKPTADGYLARGEIYFFQKDYASAIADLNASTLIDARSPTAYGYLSQAYAALGQKVKARQASDMFLVANRESGAAPAGAKLSWNLERHSPCTALGLLNIRTSDVRHGGLRGIGHSGS